jgi:hypothetical protein
MLHGAQEVHFADIQLDKEAGEAGIVRGGWACLEFRSARDAALTYPEYLFVTLPSQATLPVNARAHCHFADQHASLATLNRRQQVKS